MTWQMIQMVLYGLAYVVLIGAIILVLLPKLIDALTWDGDFPEYGKWFSREYFDD